MTNLTSERLRQLVRARERIVAEIRDERAALRRLARLEQECRENTALPGADLVATMAGSADLLRRYAALTALRVAASYEIDAALLVSQHRHQRLADARHVWFWLIREHGNPSFPTIARVVERDHTTVLHGVRRVAETPLLVARARKILASLEAHQEAM